MLVSTQQNVGESLSSEYCTLYERKTFDELGIKNYELDKKEKPSN